MLPTSFVVRIYRKAEKDGEGVVGVVEGSGIEGRKVFHTREELWSIMGMGEPDHQERGCPEQDGESGERHNIMKDITSYRMSLKYKNIN